MENTNTSTQQTPVEKNLSYLEKQLQYLGFGNDVKSLLQTEMAQNAEKENFNVTVTQHFSTPLSNKDDPHSKSLATYELNFNKDKRENVENRYFYLNSYTVYNGKNEMKIHVNPEQKNITVKEAFNLLEGRSVYKKELLKQDGGKYNAWINFDFNHINEKNQPEIHRYTDNYGFDIATELKKLPLKENQYEDRQQQLIASLEKGNLQGVTAIIAGKEQQIFMEANPQYKNFNLYELNGQNELIPVRTEVLLNNEGEQQQRSSGFKM